MKCRALSKNKNIIWFGKTGEAATSTYYEITANDTFFKGYTALPENNQITINNTNYIFKIDSGSVINGTIWTTGTSSTQVGRGSLTTPPVANYAEDTDAVVASLIQRLSIIKGELWYQVNYGLPLTEKQTGVNVFDLIIADIISSHPGVASLDKYTSKITGHTYYYSCQITSIFGDTLTISNEMKPGDDGLVVSEWLVVSENLII